MAFVFAPRGGHGIAENLKQALDEGRLPGRWGVVQDIVEAWADASSPMQKTKLSYVKAGLKTWASVRQFRESREDTVKTKLTIANWREDNQLLSVFPDHSLYSVERFALAVLTDSPAPVEELTVASRYEDVKDIIRVFEYAPGRKVYVHFWAEQKEDMTHWFGPYTLRENRENFCEWLSTQAWESPELVLTVDTSINAWGGVEKQLSVAGTEEPLDFVSGSGSSDLNAMADRLEAFLGHGFNRSLLLHGPPGTGKTSFSRALGKKMDRRLMIISPEAMELTTNHTAIMLLRLLSPGVLVFNDVDRLQEDSSELLNTLEQLLLSAGGMVVVLTVNDHTRLDPALKRPGRISEVREMSLPEPDDRRIVLGYYNDKFGLDLSTDVLETISKDELAGLSQADIREFATVAKVVGVDLARGEIGRIREQQALYGGDACHEFNRSKTSSDRRLTAATPDR